jgi:hypothetical protein
MSKRGITLSLEPPGPRLARQGAPPRLLWADQAFWSLQRTVQACRRRTRRAGLYRNRETFMPGLVALLAAVRACGTPP